MTLATARDPLLLKLEALAGKAADVGLSEAAREGRILTLQSTLLERMELLVRQQADAADAHRDRSRRRVGPVES